MIHYLSYYRSDKNLGLAINERIDSLYATPDDWIVINDLDVCYLTPNSGRQIEDIARKVEFNTGLIGCLTNRVGVLRFLHDGQFSNEWDIRKHIATAIELERDHWAELTETNEVIPGYFMMFKKEVFDDIGGFVENDKYADGKFNSAIDQLGYKKYIAEGLYVFHLYRPGIQSINQARRSTKHLEL